MPISDHALAIFIALASALATAAYYVYVSHTMKKREGLSSSLTLAISHLSGGLALLPFWWMETAGSLTNLHGVVGALVVAAFLLVLSRELYFYAYANTAVANITVFSALTPIYAIGTAYIMLGETPNGRALGGVVLICGSIYALFLRRLPGERVGTAIVQPFFHIATSLPILCAFLSTIPTAFAATLQKQLMQSLTPVTFSFFLLLLIGSVAFLIACSLHTIPGCLRQLKQFPWHFPLVSALMLPLMHVLFSVVIAHHQTAVSLVLQRTSIVFQILFAYAALGERQYIAKRLTVSVLIIIGFLLIMI